MYERRFSWINDLINTDAKAYGVYLALLYLRFDWYSSYFESTPSTESYSYSSFESFVRDVLALRLFGRDRYEAFEAAKTFFNKLFTQHAPEALRAKSRNSLLEQIEGEFFETFTKAYKRYLKLDEPSHEFKEKVALLLRKIRSREISVSSETISGSVDVSSYYISELLKTLNLKEDEVKAFYQCLVKSGIAVDHSYGRYIIPAPSLSDDVIKLLEEGVRKTKAIEAGVEEVKATPSRFAGVRPSREVLESIVAEVLKSLGFNVQTNVKLPAKGGDIEIDVWGIKGVSGAQFRIYVSCKNWDKDVDRTVVDQEFGRVLQLYQLPHLRILIAKSLTEPAKKAAFDDGFFVVELGEKATTENAQEIYDIVYSKLKEIFMGITPERVMKAIQMLREAVKLLKEVM